MGAGPPVARLMDGVRSLVAAEDLMPAVPQLAFSGLLALDAILRFLGGTPIAVDSWPALALASVVVLCVAAVALPWRRWPVTVVGIIPVLDIGVIGVARLDAQVGGAGLLAVIPALWLGRIYGRRGALVTFVAASLLLVLPGLLYFDLTASVVSRALLIPAVAVAASLAIASALSQARVSLEDAERRQVLLEEALEEIERQRLFSEAILDTVDVGLVLLDGDGTYRSMNRRHQAFMQVAYPDGHAGRAGQLGLVFDENGTTPLLREQMPTYRASEGEEFDDCLIWIGHDPRVNRAVSVSARSVRDESGRFAGAALAYHDVTDFVRALRVKDEFVASVSHELRTPLTSIVGYVDILQDRTDLPREVLVHLGVVARNTDRLQRLVADLLHTAQVDEGPMQVMRASTD
ncbi:MAG: sensor histidine kinase, partial [Nocardioides sp.]|nr:sensor histidine kinase [Nocardioides sp.]